MLHFCYIYQWKHEKVNVVPMLLPVNIFVPYVIACIVGELGMLDEAQRAMEEADALKKVKWVLLMCF